MIVFTSVFVLYSFIVNARIISSIDNLNYGLLLFVLLSILFREIFIIICTNYINNISDIRNNWIYFVNLINIISYLFKNRKNDNL